MLWNQITPLDYGALKPPPACSSISAIPVQVGPDALSAVLEWQATDGCRFHFVFHTSLNVLLAIDSYAVNDAKAISTRMHCWLALVSHAFT